jgi:hypothetical protein
VTRRPNLLPFLDFRGYRQDGGIPEYKLRN